MVQLLPVAGTVFLSIIIGNASGAECLVQHLSITVTSSMSLHFVEDGINGEMLESCVGRNEGVDGSCLPSARRSALPLLLACTILITS